jgi:multidrug efflux pump subunit AcrB
MKNFNLSRWALEHKSLVVYFMLAIAVAGLLGYFKLGREEDPPFTIKTMVVKTLWPGATTLETVKQVTDRIEKKLEELPNLDYLKSYTKPGESVVFVYLKDSTRASEIPDLWYQARKKVGDIKQTLPEGVLGPSFNDEFGDTYSLIFALTSDGFGKRELRDYAERVRAELLGVPDVAKIDLLGTQDEKIYLEFSTQQLAAMGLDVSQLIQTLQQQNAIQPSGTLNADAEKTRSAYPASSPRKRASRPSTSGSTADSFASATLRRCAGTMSTRSNRCFATTAFRRSASPSQ